MDDLADVRAFSFTELRVEQCIRLLAAGKVKTKSDGRRYWRDSGSPHGLHLLASAKGGTYYRLSKKRGRRVYTRIGDALAMRLTKARDAALRLAGGDEDAAAPPIRVRTDGITVERAWQAYIADTKNGDFVIGKKPPVASTIKSYEQLYGPHLKARYGQKTLHALAKDIPALMKSMKDKPATANRLLQVIRNLFTHSARTGSWERPNPTIDTTTGRTFRKFSVQSRERHLTTAEASRIMAFAKTEPDPWCDFWVLLLLTGVRASTLREMKWAHLDLRAESTWAVPTTKNGDPQLVALVGTAAEILKSRWERAEKKRGHSGSPWVFPMREDRKRCISDLDNAWARVKKHAKIDGVRIHDLRRTAGSWATQGGAPLPAVGKMLGHRSMNSTAIYARADISAARSAAEIVERRLRESTSTAPAKPAE
jgi:integrase